MADDNLMKDGFDYSHKAMLARRRERGRELAAERELWRAQYLIRQGTHVAISKDASEADIERMARAMRNEDMAHSSGDDWSEWDDEARAAHSALVNADD